MNSVPTARPRVEVLVNDFVRSVYNWMCVGLALTGVAAYYVSAPDMMNLIFGSPLLFGLIILANSRLSSP